MSTSLEEGTKKVAPQESCVKKLTELFPKSSPLRIAVNVSKPGAGQKQLEEQTIIEFGTAHEVLFATKLPLEFKDNVRVVNADNTIDMQGTVVAVQCQNDRKAVAVRFTGKLRHWIIPS